MILKVNGTLCVGVRTGGLLLGSLVSDLASGVGGGTIHHAKQWGEVWVWGQDEEFDFGHI